MKIRLLAAALTLSLTMGSASAERIVYKEHKVTKIERPFHKACREALDGAKGTNCKCVAIKAVQDDAVSAEDITTAILSKATASIAASAIINECSFKKGKKGKNNKGKKAE